MEDHLQNGRRQSLRRLCAENEIAEGQGRGFAFGAGIEREAIFVIRWHGKLLGYRNACPHIGIPLDWPENRFFDIDGKFLMCGGHGAVFRAGDGFCFEGPCTGQSLERIDIKVDGGAIYWVE
jgi:nitrite reductase/ring-hydroxylating ferredoxin subunit